MLHVVMCIGPWLEMCCHSCREKKQGSPWRDRPIAENLTLFDDMRRGLVDEGEMTLRYIKVLNL